MTQHRIPERGGNVLTARESSPQSPCPESEVPSVV
jgi:hypothetical protein